jgi:hypothetical protein
MNWLAKGSGPLDGFSIAGKYPAARSSSHGTVFEVMPATGIPSLALSIA